MVTSMSSAPRVGRLPLLSGEVLRLGIAQHLGQLEVPVVIGQDEDRLWMQLASVLYRASHRSALLPAGPRLQPEDLRCGIARLRGSEEIPGDHRIGLGSAAIDLITKLFAQCLRGTADNNGDVVL